MSKPEKIQGAEARLQKDEPDYSCELPVIICKLCALGQLMMGWCETRGAVELDHEEISGIGMLINNIGDDLKKINHGLYGN